eukprot:TRINITY_DN23479_c0_g1_i1.p1 TRINITY_DN23479_c0_g1~~TRINITY_DN23479_c0_g1_i1.p1  ORF type:complete len:100 (-),score=36.43 TRINITY_DN23479_c0_g1_i1:9-263(-)
MTTLPSAEKLIKLFENFDDGNTGKLPSDVMRCILQEAGDKFKDDEWQTLKDDLDRDGMCDYKWYVETILCNSEGIGNYNNWLKQ